MQTITSMAFNQNVTLAKKNTCNGPVFITEMGKITHVLMRYEDYLAGKEEKNMAELLACEEIADIDLEIVPWDFHPREGGF